MARDLERSLHHQRAAAPGHPRRPPPAADEPEPQARLLQAPAQRNLSKTREALGAEIQGDAAWEGKRRRGRRWGAPRGGADHGRRSGATDDGGARRRRASSRRRAGGAIVRRRGARRAARRDARGRSPARARTGSTCAARPTVIMAVGVNGTGKTNGRSASSPGNLQREPRPDGRARRPPNTFRAARRRAARRLGRSAPGCEKIVTGREGFGPPARWRSKAVKQGAGRRGAGCVVIIDTARASAHAGQPHGPRARPRLRRVHLQADRGRARTRRCSRGRCQPRARNGLRQAKPLLRRVVPVDGNRGLTKLDGTAKGGIALRDRPVRLGIPVKAHRGSARRSRDLRPFDADRRLRPPRLADLNHGPATRTRRDDVRRRGGRAGTSPSDLCGCATAQDRGGPAAVMPIFSVTMDAWMFLDLACGRASPRARS